MCFVEVSVCKKVDFWILSTAQSQILTLWDCRSPSHSVDIWVRNETRKSTFIQIGPLINQFLCVLACGFPHYLLVCLCLLHSCVFPGPRVSFLFLVSSLGLFGSAVLCITHFSWILLVAFLLPAFVSPTLFSSLWDFGFYYKTHIFLGRTPKPSAQYVHLCAGGHTVYLHMFLKTDWRPLGCFQCCYDSEKMTFSIAYSLYTHI